MVIALAKGCDVYGMMAEIYGKKSGLCAGKGGSMHIADLSKGMLGANNVTELGGTARLNTGSAQYPNRIKDGNLSGSARGVNQWFDTSAYVFAPMYTFGNSEIRNLIMPGALVQKRR